MEGFSTTDFYTAAILIAKGFEVTEVSKEGAGLKVKRFHFEDNEDLRKTILLYTNGSLEGNLRGFRNSIENVKDLVHSS